MSFQQAVTRANSYRGKANLGNDQMLQLYAHYKQATAGPNTTPQPGMLNFKDSAKWKAWKALGTLPKATAEAKYAALVNQYFK